MENKKVQCLVNIADKSKPSCQTATVFAWSSKKHVVLHYPDGRLYVFCWQILLRSFNGLEPGGPESTDKKVKERERGWYSLVYAESQ